MRWIQGQVERRGFRLLVAGLVAGLGLGACTPPAAQEAAEDRDDLPAEAFRDDFSDGGSGWPTGDGDGVEISYADGGYLVAVQAGKVALLPAPVRRGASGVRVQVSVERLHDPDGHRGVVWGVVCGEDLAGDRFYQAVVQVSDGLGYPGLFRWQEGDATVFRKADQPHDAVDADGINVLELHCDHRGDAVSIRFLINGEEVARAVDTVAWQIAGWETGVIADGSPFPSREEARIRFDDFVFEPVPSAP
jgi:hypothetical protein